MIDPRLAPLCISTHDLVKRSGWEAGPWDDEPDRVEWTDPRSGLGCLVNRAPAGHLCGYVRVPSGHPWHGLDYGSVRPHPDVHGGLTFSDEFDRLSVAGYWLGFDCAHLGDRIILDRQSIDPDDRYRDFAYVMDECADLAAAVQAAAVAS